MGTTLRRLRPGCPSSTRDIRRQQAQDGHEEIDTAPPARRSEVTQPIVGRKRLRPLVLLLALLSPGPCCGFHDGSTGTVGWLRSPPQQRRFMGCRLERSHAESSHGVALQPLAAAASGRDGTSSENNSANRPRQQQQRRQHEPPPRNRQQQQRRQPKPLEQGVTQAPASTMSIEAIAAALESGQSQTAATANNSNNNNRRPREGQQHQQQQQQQRQQRRRRGGSFSQDREVTQVLDSRGFAGRDGAGNSNQRQGDRDWAAAGLGVGGRDPKVYGEIVGGGGTGGGKKSKGNPNKLSLKKRRARSWMDQLPEEKQLQNNVAAALKAGDAEATLRSFNTVMDMQVPLRPHLLSGVLNQCAKAGLMDDCMRVVVEMKRRGVVIEENTYVPLIRGMVRHGDCQGAFGLVKDMVHQGVQPRLRCYEPVIAGICREGDMDFAREAWTHMEQQGVVPREDQYVDYLSGLAVAGELWEHARSGKLDEKLLEMSYHARNLTTQQVEVLEGHFNSIPVTAPMAEGTAESESDSNVDGDAGSNRDPDPGLGNGQSRLDRGSDRAEERDGERQRIMEVVRASLPLARRVKVAGGHEIDDDSWPREWSSRKPLAHPQSDDNTCPACRGRLRAVGLTNDERARIRETIFGLAGLQVKKHARSRHTKLLGKSRQRLGEDPGENPFYSFTDEDQQEQLQIFVDWLHSQRADGKTYTAVIDSANVAYHKGSAFHFSLPQVDLMVRALEFKGERPLVVIAEKYIDRVGDLYDNVTPGQGSFKYMCNPLNKAIVQRWRAKSQLYECSDEASDDWYWMYAAVAFDDIPMTVISNDRTRDHRMSLAETVPYLRWRTTQLAQFELTYAMKGVTGKGRVLSWPRNPPQVAIQPPPAFTRDVQRSDEGCWHIPAGADDEWLCIDVQRGLRMGLDKLVPPPRKKCAPRTGADAATGIVKSGRGSGEVMSGVAASAAVGGGEGLSSSGSTGDETLKQVGGLLQSMRVKKQHNRPFRYSTQGTVEEAAMAAKALAAKARAETAAADALVAEALFADAQTAGGLDPGSKWADALGADAAKVNARLNDARFSAGLSEDGLVERSFGQQREVGRQEPEQPAGVRRGGNDEVSRAAVEPPKAAASVGFASRPTTTTRTPVTAAKVIKPAPAPRAATVVQEPAATAAVTPAAPEAALRGLETPRGSKASPLNRKDGQLEESESSLTGESGRTNHAVQDGGPGNRSYDRVEGGLEVDSVAGAPQLNEEQQGQRWSSMTVVALKDELRRRGLKVSGRKEELVERLLRA